MNWIDRINMKTKQRKKLQSELEEATNAAKAWRSRAFDCIETLDDTVNKLRQYNEYATELEQKLQHAETWSTLWKEKATQMRYRWIQDMGRAESFREMFGSKEE